MHTFFINTTQNDMRRYDKLLEMQMETSRLVWLDCPILKWEDASQGYRQCVYRVNTIIDNYSSIGNSYNLIVYVNLCDFVEYADIPVKNYVDRDAMRRALRPLLIRYIKSTVVDALKESARSPREVLVMFEEDEEPKDKLDLEHDGDRKKLMSIFKSLLAIPPVETIRSTVQKYDGVVSKECLDELVLSEDGVIRGVLRYYRDLFEVYVNRIAGGDAESYATDMFVDGAFKSNVNDNDVYKKSFYFNQNAMSSNNTELTQRDLVILLYLLRCVENNSVRARDEHGEFCDYALENTIIDWNKLAKELSVVAERYETKKGQIGDIGLTYMDGERRLAPLLYKFDSERFGIDKNGKPLTKIVAEEVSTTNTATGINVKKQEVVARDVEIEPPFSGFAEFKNADEYKPTAVELTEKSPISDFEVAVSEMKEYYIDYNRNLSSSVKEALSNYADDSSSRKEAWLKRRSVTIDDATEEEHLRYAHEKPQVETLSPDTLDSFTKVAYDTCVERYLRFSASRSVVVNDIKEQCDWFQTSIDQIKESLSKMKKITIGMAISLLFVLIPFLMTQWFGIMENSLTRAIGIISLGVPFLLLYGVVLVLINRQHKLCFKKWNELLEKVNKSFEADEAAKDYEKLLSTIIPSLRASYDYRMNAVFYMECCSMINAKLEHHKMKLKEYTDLIKMILNDLQVNVKLEEGDIDREKYHIDYNVPFCVGEQNIKFYSILDDSFIDRIKEGKGGE